MHLALLQMEAAFDFETISDVIFHLKYTARDGGNPLRQKAKQALASAPQNDLVRLLSARHEYPADWYRFLNPNPGSANSLALELTAARFPYQFRGKTITISKAELFLDFKDTYDPQTYSTDGTPLGDYTGAKPLTSV